MKPRPNSVEKYLKSMLCSKCNGKGCSVCKDGSSQKCKDLIRDAIFGIR
jgi:hypothetical protein